MVGSLRLRLRVRCPDYGEVGRLQVHPRSPARVDRQRAAGRVWASVLSAHRASGYGGL